MLVIISDLHFCDGTATRNVNPKAFQLLHKEIQGLAAQVKAKQIELVFLGDVFDLLRTERWFERPVAERPWGSAAVLDGAPHAQATLDHALTIATDIAQTNDEALRALRGEGAEAGVPVKRVYIPGNHDRLYLHDERIRKQVRTALGLGGEAIEGVFPHRIEMPRYGLLARHGHEWDAWNFERHDDSKLASQYRDEDYLVTPIGDPITTELVARLPHELRARLVTANFPAEELTRVEERMRRIEDVRPLWASFSWIFYEATRLSGRLEPEIAEQLHRALGDTVRTLAHDFKRLDYYRAWYDKHHHWYRADSVDQLETLLEALSVLNADHVAGMVAWFERQFSRFGTDRDDCKEGARREKLDGIDGDARYVVYGHTHDALQEALRVEGAAHDLYLNSGTWRRREFQTLDRAGFIGWEMFTYLVFYDRSEVATGPAYETWTGTRC